MTLTRTELLDHFSARGVPPPVNPDEVNGDIFGFVDLAFVRDEAWPAFITLLQADPSAKLTVQRDIGGGKTITVPNWHTPGAVCRHWGFAFYGFLLFCLMKKAVNDPTQQHDGYAVAPCYYTAEPRAADLGRAGRHCRIFGIGADGEPWEFEEGDGDPEPMTDTELASITFRSVT